MDQIASVLLSFPSGDNLVDNDQYNAAAKAHVKRLNQFKKDEGPLLAAHAPQLLQHVDPAFNSISYLYLLHTLFNEVETSNLPEDLLDCTVRFLLTFDARQIRYAGVQFSSLLEVLKDNQTFPPSVAVEALASALLRLDPTGSILTSHHLPLVELALQTDNIPPAMPVISKSIVFYPGMRGQTETRPLCDMRLPPSAYVSIESGLTARVTSTTVLKYDMFCGLCHLSQGDWASASDAFERVMTFPTRDSGVSKIMAQAYNKWVLVGLRLVGKLRPMPSPSIVAAAVVRAYTTLGKPYVALARAFEKSADEGGAEQLKGEFEAEGESLWAEEQNLGLVREVMAHYQRHHILRLREVYSKIGLEDIRQLTHSAETGKPLERASDVETLLREMISSGMLAGVIEKPAGDVEGDGNGHLTFLSEGDGLPEDQVAAEIAAAAQRIHNLAPVVKATNERLATSRDYVRHLVREQKREKDGATAGGNGGGVSFKDTMVDMGFDSQIEDEDLMTGVMGAGV